MHSSHVYGKKYKRGSKWSEPELRELLQIWSDMSVQIELVTHFRIQDVFNNRIAITLRQKGINRTGDQCRDKIKKFKFEYKQKTSRSARYSELMERAKRNRSAATSGSTLSLWGGTVANQVIGPQGSEVPGHAPRAGDILEIKKAMSTDDEAAEMLCDFVPVDEDGEHINAGPNTEEQAEMHAEQENAHVICSPSGKSGVFDAYFRTYSATATKHHLHDVVHTVQTNMWNLLHIWIERYR